MYRIQLARQGQTMEHGTIVQWNKHEGESIEIGEVLYEVETEKAIVPIEATRPGRLVKLMAQPGETVPVGAVLAIAAEPGEQTSTGQVDAFLGQSESADAATNAAPAGEALAQRTVASSEHRAAAIPKARVLARELGVDLANVEGSGEGGVIMPDDVRRAARHKTTPAGSISRRVPLSPIARSTIAALASGWQTPQFTQGILVDASELVRHKTASAGGLSYMDFFLDALVRAAREVPDVLARVRDSEIHYCGSIDVSIATATERGLLVPVLRDAGATSIEQRGAGWRALVDRARAGKLKPEEMSGGIIALSNLGTRGVDSGTALLPAGHAAIAFFGALEPRALVVDGRLEARPSVHASITYDHRVVDGVLASRFTSAVRTALEAPSQGNTQLA